MSRMPRKIYDLDDETCARIKRYRHANEFESETKAVRALLKFALDEAESRGEPADASARKR